MLRMLSPITPGKGIIYCNLSQDVLLRWVSYFIPLGERGTILPPLESYCPAAKHYIWNGTCSMESGENMEVLV